MKWKVFSPTWSAWVKRPCTTQRVQRRPDLPRFGFMQRFLWRTPFSRLKTVNSVVTAVVSW